MKTFYNEIEKRTSNSFPPWDPPNDEFGGFFFGYQPVM